MLKSNIYNAIIKSEIMDIKISECDTALLHLWNYIKYNFDNFLRQKYIKRMLLQKGKLKKEKVNERYFPKKIYLTL